MKFASPETLQEAIALLGEDGARCLAGGQSLVAMMNARLVAPSTLVSLRRVAELSTVASMPDGGLRIGAMASHAAVARLKPTAPGPRLVCQAAATIGHPAIRNQGTIGGSLAHADPAADYPTAILAADARILVAGAAGRRSIAAGDFFRGYYETALAEGEMIVAVEVPPGPAHAAVHYEKYSLVHGDFAVISVAVILAMEGGRCASIRLSVGACAPAPLRSAEAEALLAGTTLDDVALAAAGAVLAEACDPLDDARGSAEFRRKLVPRMTKRAILAAKEKGPANHA